MEKPGLSACAYHRVLKVARTIGDLAGEREVVPQHVAERFSTVNSADRCPSNLRGPGFEIDVLPPCLYFQNRAK